MADGRSTPSESAAIATDGIAGLRAAPTPPSTLDAMTADSGRYEITVDSDECVSAGKCVASAPGFFIFDADEIAAVDADGLRPSEEAILHIARTCPSGAIRLSLDGVDIEL